MRYFILFKYRKKTSSSPNIFGAIDKRDQKENFQKDLLAKFWRFFKREYFLGQSVVFSHHSIKRNRPQILEPAAYIV